MTKTPNTTTQLFSGEIKQKNDKKVIAWNSPDFVRFQIEKFTVGTKITAYLSSKKPTRSLLQNNFYHLYKKLIADETGGDVEALHALFKGKFLSKGICEVYGEKVRVVKSTTELNKSEFVEFMLRIEELTEIPIPSTEEWNPKHY